jgi:hypothetical protein
MNKKHSAKGSFVQIEDKRVGFNVQAYAPDVILASERPWSVQEMLSMLETYVQWARMEVNVAKCAMLSHLIDGNNHRCTPDQELMFTGQGISNLMMAQLLEYLGIAVSTRGKVRLEAATVKSAEMDIRLQRVIGSRLLMIQKGKVTKISSRLTLHLGILNGDVSKKQLRKMDATITTQVDALLSARGLPVERHRASRRDGGLGHSSLVD